MCCDERCGTGGVSVTVSQQCDMVGVCACHVNICRHVIGICTYTVVICKCMVDVGKNVVGVGCIT